MLVKIGEHWVNPKYVIRVTTGYEGRVLIIPMDQNRHFCLDVMDKGVTADLVARYLNDCERERQFPNEESGWKFFLERMTVDA